MYAVGAFADSPEETSIRFRISDRKVETSTIFEILGSFTSISIFSYCLWISVGIVFYSYYDDFTNATAFFYTMEAGLSIGFCNPGEKDDWSKLFTIFYVIAGSLILTGGVSTLVAMLVRRRLNISRSLAHKEGLATLRDPVTDKITVLSFLRYVWYTFKLHIGWYSDRTGVIVFILFLFWMAVGTIYGMLEEGWSFITALYWAVTTVSTGGLQSPPCLHDSTGDTCDIGDLRGTLMGLFIVFGVPIYAVFIGHFAVKFVQGILRKHALNALAVQWEDSEFKVAALLLSPHSSETSVSCGEYVLFELIRLGYISEDDVRDLKERFLEFDPERKGYLHIDEMRKLGIVVPAKPLPFKADTRKNTVLHSVSLDPDSGLVELTNISTI
jgi:hypothetical protein